jgi:hypothetical protein
MIIAIDSGCRLFQMKFIFISLELIIAGLITTGFITIDCVTAFK